jgi:hypothetical protein
VHLLRYILGSDFSAELAGSGDGDRELDEPIATDDVIVRRSRAIQSCCGHSHTSAAYS